MSGPIRADRIQIRPVSWLWRERVPRGMMTIFGGRPDKGKGLMSARVAADVSNTKVQREDGTWRWGRVLYSAIEDSHEVMTAPRLQAAGANMKNVHVWRFQLMRDWDELEYILLEEEIDLLVMDPLAAHLSGGVSRHSDNIRTVTNPLTNLAEETQTAVLAVEHVLKHISPNAHPLQSIGGSGSGLAAAARMAYLIGVDPKDDDRRLLANIKSNISEPPMALAFEIDQAQVDVLSSVPFLTYVDEVNCDARLLVASDKSMGVVGRPPEKVAQAAEWLANYLYKVWNCKPVPVSKIEEDAKQYKISPKTMRRAAADMKIIKNPPGGGPKVTWELPQGLIKRMDILHGKDKKAVPQFATEPKDKIKPTGTPAPETDSIGGVDVSDLDTELSKLLNKDGKGGTQKP